MRGARLSRCEDRAIHHRRRPAVRRRRRARGRRDRRRLVGDPLYAGVELTGEQIPLADVRLLAPVIPRSKVACIGRNYAAHAAELGNDVPEEPLVFLKPNTSVIGPRDPIVYPRAEQRRPVRRRARGRHRPDLPRRPASNGSSEVIFGYTVANDVTARDLQKKDGQWTRAKGFDSFCPLGPWIETQFDPVRRRGPHRAERRGEAASAARSLMMFDVPAIIAYITSFMTLLAR